VTVPCYLVDTNVLIRFLRNDHKEHSPASRRLFEKARAGKALLQIPFVTISETFHVLRTLYKIERVSAAREVIKILNAPGVSVSAPAWIHDAVNEYLVRNVSFGDACVAAEARLREMPVATFDQDFDAFENIVRFEPK
jgi:predicted nucleic-acid-binding protein